MGKQASKRARAAWHLLLTESGWIRPYHESNGGYDATKVSKDLVQFLLTDPKVRPILHPNTDKSNDGNQ